MNAHVVTIKHGPTGLVIEIRDRGFEGLAVSIETFDGQAVYSHASILDRGPDWAAKDAEQVACLVGFVDDALDTPVPGRAVIRPAT